MKYRSDFVTNSSSSSFLVAFNSKDEGLAEIAKMSDWLGDAYLGWILRDFQHAEPIPLDQIGEHWKDDLEGDAGTAIDYDSRWNDSEFKKAWLAAHPDKKPWEYYSSPERQAKVEAWVKEELESIKADLKGRSYLVDIEYEDHCDIGNELEHYIMPKLDCTVRRFNRH